MALSGRDSWWENVLFLFYGVPWKPIAGDSDPAVGPSDLVRPRWDGHEADGR